MTDELPSPSRSPPPEFMLGLPESRPPNLLAGLIDIERRIGLSYLSPSRTAPDARGSWPQLIMSDVESGGAQFYWRRFHSLSCASEVVHPGSRAVILKKTWGWRTRLAQRNSLRCPPEKFFGFSDSKLLNAKQVCNFPDPVRISLLTPYEL